MTNTAKTYVQYHNREVQGKLTRARAGGAGGIGTNKELARETIGHRIVLIEGFKEKGENRKSYYLAETFIAENIELLDHRECANQ